MEGSSRTKRDIVLSASSAVLNTPFYKSRADQYLDQTHRLALAEHGPKLSQELERINDMSDELSDTIWNDFKSLAEELAISSAKLLHSLVDPLAAAMVAKVKLMFAKHKEIVEGKQVEVSIALLKDTWSTKFNKK